MQAMVIASSVIRAHNATPTELYDRELYAGPSQNLKDLVRVAATFTGIALYVGLLGVLGRHAASSGADLAVRPIAAAVSPASPDSLALHARPSATSSPR